MPVEVQTAYPATPTIRFPTALSGNHLDGPPTTQFITISMRSELSLMAGYAGDDPRLEVHTMAEPDIHEGSWPYVFGSGHTAIMDDGHGHEHGHA